MSRTAPKTSAEHHHPSVTVDVVLLTEVDRQLRALYVRRREAPFAGVWALPGGFVRAGESLDTAAARVLRDKANLDGVFLEQLYTFSDPGRDPRARVITVAYVALVDAARAERAQLASGAEFQPVVVPWEGETGGPIEAELAFDHAEIVGMAVKRLRGKLDYAPIGFQLLPERFTLLDLQRVHETVLGRPLNKDSFRRRMLASGLLEATGHKQRDVGHRPAELYRFTKRPAV